MSCLIAESLLNILIFSKNEPLGLGAASSESTGVTAGVGSPNAFPVSNTTPVFVDASTASLDGSVGIIDESVGIVEIKFVGSVATKLLPFKK